MKILFLTNLFPPNIFGGYERLCYDVASALKARGHEIIVLTSSYGKNSNENYGYTVKRNLFLFATEGNIYQSFDVPKNKRLQHEVHNQKVFESVVDEINPDFIFVWNLYFFDRGLLRAIDACSLPKTYLLTDNWMIAQLNADFIGSYFSKVVFGSVQKQNVFINTLRKITRPVIGLFSRKSFEMNGRAIFPSKYMKSLYDDAGFSFKSGEAICYHGVRFLHLADVKRVMRHKLINAPEVRLLFAGRVVDIKGVHTAIESVQSLRKRFGNDFRVILTIIGGTEDKGYLNKIEQLIESLGVQDSIVFKPAVAEDELFGMFQEHDIYLFPSLYEPFSLTLILALESGIPTVASNVGGNVEIVHNGKTGLIFRAGDGDDLADKIHSLIENNNLREKISRSAVAYAGEFTFDSMISRIEKDLKGESI